MGSRPDIGLKFARRYRGRKTQYPWESKQQAQNRRRGNHARARYLARLHREKLDGADPLD